MDLTQEEIDTKSQVYSVKRLFKEPKEKSKPKFTFSDVAKQAAVKAQKRELRKPAEDFRIASLFKSNKHDYKIEKIKEYKYSKFNSSRSEYKIYGDVDIFQVHSVITELINKMTTGLPDNVKLQISLENDKNDKVNQTKLLNKTDVIAKLADWVILFIDYQDMEIEDITIKLLKIEIPTGSGRTVNKIITVHRKRSIIHIRNKDTICLARAIVVGLAVQSKEKFQDIFRNNITDEELKQINKYRQCKSRINEGIISDNEKTYLVDGRKLQEVLAKALHRMCSIPIKETGNGFQDVKEFEEQLNIEIQVYNLEARQIYRGNENLIKVYILMSETHYGVISNIAGFTCANAITTTPNIRNVRPVKVKLNAMLLNLKYRAQGATSISMVKLVSIIT